MPFDLDYEYSTFSGHDMVAVFTMPGIGHKVFGELLMLSYSVHRPLIPVRTLGRIGAKGYARGARTIAGSLIFQVVDRHIIHAFKDQLMQLWESQIVEGIGGRYTTRRSIQRHLEAMRSRTMLMDEVPPFNITVTAGNEFGAGGHFMLAGCRIQEEGQVVSVTEVSPYQNYTFVAQEIFPMTPTDLRKSNSHQSDPQSHQLGDV